MDKLLTPKQLSELLQVDQSTVYWWSHTGFIPHVKLGKLVRFKEEEVEQWVKERVHHGRRALKLSTSNLS